MEYLVISNQNILNLCKKPTFVTHNIKDVTNFTLESMI
jgi:hypothetical protein